MKAMILAAGRGERLRPLTDVTPKPLLSVAGRPLIEYTLEALVSAGFSEIIINLAYLGGQIRATLGDGARFGAMIRYSDEGDSALETAGGIINALPLLGSEPFVVVNGDIATDFPFAQLRDRLEEALAHLILVPNPPFHPEGDFGLEGCRISVAGTGRRYTYSGIGIYHPNLFAQCQPGKSALGALLRRSALLGKVTGELYSNFWMDIGTKERLQALREHQQRCIGSKSRGMYE